MEYPPYSDVDREGFIAIAREHVPQHDIFLIEAAYDMAVQAHLDQKRHCGRDFVEHPVEVAIILMIELAVRDWHYVVLALLHDVFEDGEHADRHVRIYHAFGHDIVNSLHLLTKHAHRDYLQDLRARGHAREWTIKLCDRLHNLRSLDVCSLEKRRRQIEQTRINYVPLAELLVRTLGPKNRWRGTYLLNQISAICEDRARL